MNVHTHRHTGAHTAAEGPNGYKDILTEATTRNWAVLTALIHQGTSTMQSKVKFALLFLCINREAFLNSYCILGCSPLSAVVKRNNSELEKLGRDSGLSSLPLRLSPSHTHTCILHRYTDKPMFKPPPFSLFPHFIPLFFSRDMKLLTRSIAPSFLLFLYKHKVTRWLLSLHTDSSFRTRKNVKNV